VALRLREIDDDSIEALLEGTGGAPDGYERVAELLGRLRERQAPEPDEVVVTRMQAVVEQQLAGATRGSARWRRLVLAGVIGGGALVALGGLGAAGALPDAIQRPVSDVLGTVGIDAPSPDDVSTPSDGSAPADDPADGRRIEELDEVPLDDGSATAEPAIPATPATPAIPADPSGSGPATPAVPAVPATPATPAAGGGPPADSPSATAPGQVDPGPNGNGQGHGYGRGGKPASGEE
jgi:hypothetical protein